ncbi:MAG: hypothetical protein EP343_07395 [Deltaproteobacteria bacterium]|nr:MAG: hypothetical protein EP343_07395 [Deltaproteobacteria bacterium]
MDPSSQPDSYSSLASQGLPQPELPWVVPKPLPSHREATLLKWAEEEIFEQIRKEKRRISQPALHIRWPGWLALVSMAMLGFALLQWPPATQQPPPLRIHGLNAAHSHWPPQAHHPLWLQSHEKAVGFIHRRHHWHAETSADAQLKLHQTSSKHVKLHLHKGHVHVQVKPGSMHHFAIHSHPYRVMIRGTSVSVMRDSTWLHIEVTSGKVQWFGPHTHQTLVAGEGVRIHLKPTARTHLSRYKWTRKAHNHHIPLPSRQTPSDLHEHTLPQ